MASQLFCSQAKERKEWDGCLPCGSVCQANRGSWAEINGSFLWASIYVAAKGLIKQKVCTGRGEMRLVKVHVKFVPG